MCSEIQTMSSGRPTEIFTIPQNGPKRQVNIQKGEIERDTMKTITAGQEEEVVKVQITLTAKETETLKGKRVITNVRKDNFLRGHEVVEGDGHAVRRGEAGVAIGAQPVAVAEVPLGREVEVENDPAAEAEIVEFVAELLFKILVDIKISCLPELLHTRDLPVP